MATALPHRRPATTFMITSSQLSSLSTYASMSQSRLKKLYSDFSLQKHSDPTSYASILEWWRRTLETVVSKGWLAESDAAASQTDRLVLHAPGTTLADEFRYEGVGKPLGLPTVIVCSTLLRPMYLTHNEYTSVG